MEILIREGVLGSAAQVFISIDRSSFFICTASISHSKPRFTYDMVGSGEGKPHWSVYDGVKIIAATPEALMAEIDSAISNLEYARATALLESSSSSTPKKRSDANLSPQYDARMADEAYKAGCAALAAGKLDEALHSLNISLSLCPPDKTSAVAKLQSLISVTSKQLQKCAN